MFFNKFNLPIPLINPILAAHYNFCIEIHIERYLCFGILFTNNNYIRMKNLELKKLNVQELTAVEMKEQTGGNWFKRILPIIMPITIIPAVRSKVEHEIDLISGK